MVERLARIYAISRIALVRWAMLLLVATAFQFAMPLASAQERTFPEAANTSSPRDTLRSFIDACKALDQLIKERQFIDSNDPEGAYHARVAIDCLDTSEIPLFALEDRAGEAVVCIKEVIDRFEFPSWEEIPGVEEIEAAGGLEKLPVYRIPGTRITISRVEEGPRKHEYLVSRGTVSRSRSYFEQVRHLPYREDGPAVSSDFFHWYTAAPGHWSMAYIYKQLPDSLQRSRAFGMATWKWPGTLLTLVFTGLLLALVYGIHGRVAGAVRQQNIYRYWLTMVFPAIALLIPLGARYVIDDILTVRSQALYVLTFLMEFTFFAALAIALFGVCNRVAETIIASPHVNPRGLNAQLIRVVAKFVIVIVMLGVGIFGGQYLGIPIGTLLASAGIGGLAIALAAQDTLKSLFSTVSILMDKPCRAGDTVLIDKFEGRVEDIGLRSTKIRLKSGHVVTLPNDQIAGRNVENFSRRSHFRRDAEVQLPIDTPFDQVELAIAIIERRIQDHDKQDPDFPPRVLLEEFGPQNYRIHFYIWYASSDFWAFKKFVSAINLNIISDFSQQGIQLSLPLRHSFWKHDDQQGPLDVAIQNVAIEHEGE